MRAGPGEGCSVYRLSRAVAQGPPRLPLKGPLHWGGRVFQVGWRGRRYLEEVTWGRSPGGKTAGGEITWGEVSWQEGTGEVL